jgi:TRAP-type C4-dicarboxylate transport system permease small subunit
VLTDIIMRQIGTSLGGTEKIAGYAMALATSLRMSYTLLELGHVRIDLLRSRRAASNAPCSISLQ